jgi:hypothetical protein
LLTWFDRDIKDGKVDASAKRIKETIPPIAQPAITPEYLADMDNFLGTK